MAGARRDSTHGRKAIKTGWPNASNARPQLIYQSLPALGRASRATDTQQRAYRETACRCGIAHPRVDFVGSGWWSMTPPSRRERPRRSATAGGARAWLRQARKIMTSLAAPDQHLQRDQCSEVRVAGKASIPADHRTAIEALPGATAREFRLPDSRCVARQPRRDRRISPDPS